MSKRNKQQVSAVTHGGNSAETTAAVIHPPAKQPTLLAVSISLFALWFVFLLVTAIFG